MEISVSILKEKDNIDEDSSSYLKKNGLSWLWYSNFNVRSFKSKSVLRDHTDVIIFFS